MRFSQRSLRLASVAAALLLLITVCLPWFHLPFFGWKVPAPGWNRAGLSCGVLSTFLLLRGLGAGWSRWLIRVAVLPSLFFWWRTAALTKAWAAHHLGPAQLKMSSLNRALATMGAEPVEIYDVMAWKHLGPSYGWYTCGLVMLAVVCLTALDGPSKSKCPSCQSKVGEDDHFCSHCGVALKKQPVCNNCGAECKPDDKYCKACGSEVLEPKTNEIP